MCSAYRNVQNNGAVQFMKRKVRFQPQKRICGRFSQIQ